MSLSTSEIEKIAKLARIQLTEEEKEKFAHELSTVIDYFKQLEHVDTSKVNLELSETETVNTVRQDTAADSGMQEKILSQAPMREDAFIKVKSVL